MYISVHEHDLFILNLVRVNFNYRKMDTICSVLRTNEQAEIIFKVKHSHRESKELIEESDK